MKQLLLASALLAGLSGAAFAADDYTSANPLAGIDLSKSRGADSDARGFSAVNPPGCDQAAGSETKIAACDPQRFQAPGGTNSGSNSR
jgi:hypothetical protein